MPNFLSSDHWVHVQDRAGREVYVLSGTCILDPVLVGPSDGSRWRRGQTSFDIPLHDLPTGQGLVIEQWAPTVVLGSIQDDGAANNPGWAVDDFDVDTFGGTAVSAVSPTFNYAVGGSAGSMRRVAFSVTVVGHFAPLPVIQ